MNEPVLQAYFADELKAESLTFFSTLDFNEAWSQSRGRGVRTFAVPVAGSGPPRWMYGIENIRKLGTKTLEFGPEGLYGSPGWKGELEKSTTVRILYELQRTRIQSFIWNVRFDHQNLATQLIGLGLRYERNSTHVLPLLRDYEEVFKGYSTTMRNHVRRAQQSELVLRDASDEESIRDYYEIHRRLAHEKGDYKELYPLELFLKLGRLSNVRLIVAEVARQMVSGALFFFDGNSVLYWHGASDRAYSKYFPSCAVLDEAIRWACSKKVAFFNFGGSIGIESLERFKRSWGAHKEWNWTFVWENRVWTSLSKARRLFPQYAG